MLRTVTFAALWRCSSSRTTLSGDAPGLQQLLDALQRRGNVRITVAQALHQLHGERARQGLAQVDTEDPGYRLRRARRRTEQAVRQGIGCFPLGAAAHDAVGTAAQVLDQHQAQHARQRPQFTDCESFDALVGGDEALQQLGSKWLSCGRRSSGDAGIAKPAGSRWPASAAWR
jgi:hypothetical protein